MNLFNRYNFTILYILLSIIFVFSTTSCSDKNVYELSTEQETPVDTLGLLGVNFYLETSASMRGYVNSNVPGNYPLKDLMPFIVTDFDNTFAIESNLYTISDKQQKYRYSKAKFFDQLRAGKVFTGKSSKLQNIFADVISATGNGTVSILITDCIPDLGKINTKTEGSKITSQLYNHLVGNKSLGVAVFKYSSNFNGTHYFNRENNNGVPQSKRPFYNQILNDRPFYIWVFGEPTLVTKVLSKNIIKTYQAAHTYNLPLQKMEVGLLKYPKSGKISITPEKNTILIKEIEAKRPATFTIGLDLKELSDLQKNQLLDSLNYEVYPKYIAETISLIIKDKNTLLLEKIKDKSVIESSSYTHFVQPTLYDFNVGTEKIYFKNFNKEAEWINDTDLEDDVDISKSDLENKTFGFQFITKAFSRAFSAENASLQLTLTKQEKR